MSEVDILIDYILNLKIRSSFEHQIYEEMKAQLSDC